MSVRSNVVLPDPLRTKDGPSLSPLDLESEVSYRVLSSQSTELQFEARAAPQSRRQEFEFHLPRASLRPFQR
jgi:hypothetical protein